MDNLNFDEEKHQYTLEKENGEIIELVSVTTLLEKHGLSADYSNVNKEVLDAKAKRGKVVHEELEDYIKTGFCGFTGELYAFIKKCEEKNIKPLLSEVKVHNEEIAGTFDVSGQINGESFIGDFKTTSTIHKESVAWQLSLYAYLNGIDYKRYICFHFPDENTCKDIEVKPIPREEIERLLECERNCEIYQKKTLELDLDTTHSLVFVQRSLKELEEKKKELEEQEKNLKQEIIEKMEEFGVKSIDNEYFKITYIAPGTKETIDSKKLKEEIPDIAKQFTRISQVKAQVRITLKDA